MLQRPASGDEVCGVWNRSQLFEMDERFVAAVERAFGLGLESRAAAGATVRIGSFRNGKGTVIESALEAAWDLICQQGRGSGLGSFGVRARVGS